MQTFRLAVAVGTCIFAFLLWGIYHITKLVQALHRQQARAATRGLKARPSSVHHNSTPQPQFPFWIIATLLIIAALPPITLLRLFHPLLPMAPFTDLLQPLHDPATALDLPPAYQPAHAQWFEPARRDHVHWLEDLGSVVSVSAKASWDFWTLQLPTMPESNNTQHQPHPRRPTADFFHWAWANATCPDPRYIGDTILPGDYSVRNIIQPPFLLPASTNLCTGAVWRATSVPAHPQTAATSTSDNFIQFFLPIETITAAATTAVAVYRVHHVNFSDQLYLAADTNVAAAATPVAVFKLDHDVGTHTVAALPTAVVRPSFTLTYQATTSAAEASNAVALYRSTQQPTTPAAKTLQTLSIRGSTAVATLLLSSSPMESASTSNRHMIKYTDQIADPIATLTYTNQSTTCSTLELMGTSTGMHT